jgi:hypothetical protein
LFCSVLHHRYYSLHCFKELFWFCWMDILTCWR